METSNSFFNKIISFYKRIITYFTLVPIRLTRFWRHLFNGLTFQMGKQVYWKDEAETASYLSVFSLWVFEAFVLFLEMLGIGELYETLNDFFKYNTRPMTKTEIAMAQSVYGDTIDYTQVRIDERAYAGPKYFRFCYVSFNLINSWGAMYPSILIHELMHVWQYQKMGAIYMIRALIAQHTHCGYDYGGIQALKARYRKGEGLLDFNLEQQGDIIADYFLLKNGYHPQWGNATLKDLPIYQLYINELESVGKRPKA